LAGFRANSEIIGKERIQKRWQMPEISFCNKNGDISKINGDISKINGDISKNDGDNFFLKKTVTESMDRFMAVW